MISARLQFGCGMKSMTGTDTRGRATDAEGEVRAASQWMTTSRGRDPDPGHAAEAETDMVRWLCDKHTAIFEVIKHCRSGWSTSHIPSVILRQFSSTSRVMNFSSWLSPTALRIPAFACGSSLIGSTM